MLKIAVLISGGGTTLRNLIEKKAANLLNAEIVLVLASSPKAGGLRFAKEAGIEHHVVEIKSSATPEEIEKLSGEMLQRCEQAGVDLVVLGGFLKKLTVPTKWEGRIINIHPALIPSFCGKGFYGRRVHQAVLDYGVKLSGCTVHYVDNEYDHGAVIVQKAVPVLAEDTPETLAERVFQTECEALPEAINLIAETKQ